MAMSLPLRVLLIEDSPTDAKLLEHAMQRGGLDVFSRRVETADEMREALRQQEWDIVLSDYHLPQFSAPAALELLKQSGLDLPFIVVSGSMGEDSAVAAMRHGVNDYLTKGNLTRLIPTIERELREVQSRRERRRVEQDIRQLAALVQSSGDAIMSMTVDGVITSWNPAAERLFGWSAIEAIGRPVSSLAPADRVTEWDEIMGRLRSGAQFEQFETVRVSKEGKQIDVSVSLSPIHDQSGQLIGASKIVRDITERKNLEDQFRQAQRRLQHVLASSPAVLFTVAVAADLTWGITWTSDNLPEILGYSPAAALGKDWWLGNIHPEDREKVVAQFQADLPSQERSTYEYRFLHGDGSYRWTRGELRLIRDKAGKTVEVIGSWSDITERKNLEDQFRQAQKMEAVGRLAGGVAHDFNNMLTIINGYGELVLAKLAAADPCRALVREIVAAGDRAAGLTRQLLTFSRKAIIEPRILDLTSVVVDVDKMLRHILGEDIQLIVIRDSELCTVKADSGQMEQVMMNLAVNARDAMPRGGRLTVEVRNVELDEAYVREHLDARPGPHVLLAVSDTGCGMDRATMTRIFEPFFSTKGENGTGLGLATVHGIVKQSGGHVGVYSEVGHGTSFKVYLPRLDQEAPPEGPRTEPASMPRGSETVLLVEDEDGVRALSREVLQGFGYIVLEARDGAESIRIAEQHKGQIDLLLTDVVMPRMSGREVAERLEGMYAGMKVLFLSGYTDDAVVRHGILQAEVAFLQKPFTPATLAAKVRAVLDKK
jgi:two-component system cell cycle sensor histidine kinase/response regulator CckA